MSAALQIFSYAMAGLTCALTAIALAILFLALQLRGARLDETNIANTLAKRREDHE